jgi:hypothetical protein
METRDKYEVYLNDNWIQVNYKSDLSYMENNDNKVRKTPIEAQQKKEIEYRYEGLNDNANWGEVSKTYYDKCIEDGFSNIVRKVPIGTITGTGEPVFIADSNESIEPKPDYEGALKHVIEQLLCNQLLVGNKINIGDLLSDLSNDFNIDLKIKIE